MVSENNDSVLLICSESRVRSRSRRLLPDKAIDLALLRSSHRFCFDRTNFEACNFGDDCAIAIKN